MAFCTLRRAALGLLLLAVLAPQAGAVIGGQAAAPGAWPFAAALIDGAAADTLAGQICGAVVVAPREVVTAAHCVAPEGSVRPRKRSLDIVAGRLRLRGSASERIHVVSVRSIRASTPNRSSTTSRFSSWRGP